MTQRQEYLKPLPTPNQETKPFWDACRKHELRVQRCKACKNTFFPPRNSCPHCLSQDFEWIKCSGKGKVYSFSVVHQNRSPGFKNEGPYVIAYITLDEGVQMLSNVIGCEPYSVKVEMPVEVVFEDATPDVSLPKFKPRG